MNRRAFLQRFGIGLGAALTLAALPASAVKALSITEAGKRCATEYLRKRFNAYVAGKGLAGFPIAMHVPPGLFEAFEGEITVCQRFTPGGDLPRAERSLLFKGVAMFPDARMTGWDVRFTDAQPRDAEYAMNTTGALIA